MIYETIINVGGMDMRFNSNDYEKAFPRKERKVKPIVTDAEDKMTVEEPVIEPVKEVLEDGNTGTGESDTE